MFTSHGNHRDLHSFPTRRSSDLKKRLGRAWPRQTRGTSSGRTSARAGSPHSNCTSVSFQLSENASRSEEHTSELQSQFHLVCRLLLEKKKKNRVKTRANSKKSPW